MDPIEVICINNKSRPSEIPLSVWSKLIEGEKYTVIKVEKLNASGGILGVQLEEISLEGCAPYLYFAANRFAPIAPDKELEAVEVEELFELA